MEKINLLLNDNIFLRVLQVLGDTEVKQNV